MDTGKCFAFSMGPYLSHSYISYDAGTANFGIEAEDITDFMFDEAVHS